MFFGKLYLGAMTPHMLNQLSQPLKIEAVSPTFLLISRPNMPKYGPTWPKLKKDSLLWEVAYREPFRGEKGVAGAGFEPAAFRL